MCKYHPNRKDTDRIPEPTPFCAPPCKKNTPKTTHLPKNSHEPILKVVFLQKTTLPKTRIPRSIKSYNIPQKNCNLQPFHPLHFPTESLGGTTFLPGGNHKQSYPEPWRKQLLSVTTGAVGYRWNRC